MRLSSYADKDDARRATKSEEEVFVSGSPLHRQTMQRAFFDSRQSGRRSPFCGIQNIFPAFWHPPIIRLKSIFNP